MTREGALMAARFAFMPNRLGYCGPEENRALLEYVAEGAWDRGLEEILRRFQAAFPYYGFIAASNGIEDPFDPRVVEAYWIGNRLLENVRMGDFCRYLEERFGARFSRGQLQQILGWVPEGARPHHNFHVLTIPARTERGFLPHTVEVADQCRIAWGRVLAVDGDTVWVERRPLRVEAGHLNLGPPVAARAWWRFDGKALVSRPQPGDVVALHWGCVCGRLSATERKALVHYTRLHLDLLNRHLLASVVPW